MRTVRIIGAGLAGSEAAWQLAVRGFAVEIFEMRPLVTTKAHRSADCAELVCSNSFRGAALTNAVGLLKEELRRSHSLILEAADACAVPAGGALAVDRVCFRQFVTARLQSHPLIQFTIAEIRELPSCSREAPLIVASGPLTSPALAAALARHTGRENLAFFDAISPIVLGNTLDHAKLFRASRYGKGAGDEYLNSPLTKELYYSVVEAIRTGEKFGGRNEIESDSISELRPFEGCMPIEEMVERGPDTLLFGPLKPVGLIDPLTGRRPYAVVQLRQDIREGTLWNMVGMQTRLRHGEQERIFRLLAGFEQVEFVRFGSVHRNTFLDGPKCLQATLESRTQPGLLFAGQITGVEGYVESTAGGMVAGLNASRLLEGKEPLPFPTDTATGALMAYISDSQRQYFQPMNVSFGLLPAYAQQPKERRESKGERRLRISQQALASLDGFRSAYF